MLTMVVNLLTHNVSCSPPVSVYPVTLSWLLVCHPAEILLSHPAEISAETQIKNYTSSLSRHVDFTSTCNRKKLYF